MHAKLYVAQTSAWTFGETYLLNTKDLCSLSYTPAHDHTNLRDTAGRDDKAKNVAFTVTTVFDSALLVHFSPTCSDSLDTNLRDKHSINGDNELKSLVEKLCASVLFTQNVFELVAHQFCS